MAGAHSPDERLTEERLALHYNVSRVPVREAIRNLEAEGFLPGGSLLGDHLAVDASERPHSVPPGRHGGNLDVNLLGRGSVPYLPVQVPGALFYGGTLTSPRAMEMWRAPRPRYRSE